MAQRQRLKLLLDERGKPLGGKWSLDSDNRDRLPAAMALPTLPRPDRTSIVTQAIASIEAEFPDHPGRGEDFWLPVSRADARFWWQRRTTGNWVLR